MNRQRQRTSSNVESRVVTLTESDPHGLQQERTFDRHERRRPPRDGDDVPHGRVRHRAASDRLRRTARLVVIFTATVLAGVSAIAGYRFLTRDPDVGDAKSCGDFAPDPECERAQKERQFERYLRNHPLPP